MILRTLPKLIIFLFTFSYILPDWKPCLADSNGGTAQYKYYHYNNYDPNNPHGSPQDPNTDSKDPYSRDYSQNYVNYGFDYGGGISYDYSDVKTDPLQCFSCHYHIQYGHAVGMKECNDPFNKTVIPDVTCEGPCGVSSHCLTYCLTKPELCYVSHVIPATLAFG